MKRKIIITESQYIKLQELLFETADINHTLDFIKVGDALKFKTPTGSDYTINVKQVNRANNEILGDNHGIKVILRYNSYDEKSKKLNYQEFDKNTNKYVNKSDDVNELDIVRNGKVVDITNAGSGKQINPATPEEIDPNAEITDKEEGYDDEDYKEMIKNIDAELKSDNVFRQALYKQPNFWERLTGSNPSGHGIIIANKLLDSYKDKGSNDFLGGNFIKNNIARYKVLKEYKIPYDIEGVPYYIIFKKGDEREAKVNEVSNDNKQRNLTDKGGKFKLIVTKNISKENNTPNLFLCDIITYSIKKGNQRPNEPIPIELQFLQSTGFNIKQEK
jgi:hypothetical protein